MEQKSPLAGKTVILGISGGIAAYKCCDLVRLLKKRGADVHVVMTKAAQNFVAPLVLQTLSGNPVDCDLFRLRECCQSAVIPRCAPNPPPGHVITGDPSSALPPQDDNSIKEGDVAHISLADRADVILIAPATADLIAKVSHGICDELLTATICATKSPVIFAPSMNENMWTNAITQENCERLKKLGYKFIPPEEGELACGYDGKGRLPELKTIVDVLEKIVVGCEGE